MSFQTGDRVRIRKPASEYTGCRGCIVDDPGGAANGVTPLGHWVAIDGENGVARPFLVEDLDALRPARVRVPAREAARSGGA